MSAFTNPYASYVKEAPNLNSMATSNMVNTYNNNTTNNTDSQKNSLSNVNNIDTSLPPSNSSSVDSIDDKNLMILTSHQIETAPKEMTSAFNEQVLKIQKSEVSLEQCNKKFLDWQETYKNHPDKKGYDEYCIRWDTYKKAMIQEIKKDKESLLTIKNQIENYIASNQPKNQINNSLPANQTLPQNNINPTMTFPFSPFMPNLTPQIPFMPQLPVNYSWFNMMPKVAPNIPITNPFNANMMMPQNYMIPPQNIQANPIGQTQNGTNDINNGVNNSLNNTNLGKPYVTGYKNQNFFNKNHDNLAMKTKNLHKINANQISINDPINHQNGNVFHNKKFNMNYNNNNRYNNNNINTPEFPQKPFFQQKMHYPLNTNTLNGQNLPDFDNKFHPKQIMPFQHHHHNHHPPNNNMSVPNNNNNNNNNMDLHHHNDHGNLGPDFNEEQEFNQNHPEAPLETQMHTVIPVESVVDPPDRKLRPKITIIIRGMPGTGKEEAANAIVNLEKSNGAPQDSIKIISIYDIYNFITDQNLNTLQKINFAHSEMIKIYKKVVDLYDFIVIIGIFDLENKIYDIVKESFGRNIDIFVVEIPHDFDKTMSPDCKIKFDEQLMFEMNDNWQMTPKEMYIMDIRSLLSNF